MSSAQNPNSPSIIRAKKDRYAPSPHVSPKMARRTGYAATWALRNTSGAVQNSDPGLKLASPANAIMKLSPVHRRFAIIRSGRIGSSASASSFRPDHQDMTPGRSAMSASKAKELPKRETIDRTVIGWASVRKPRARTGNGHASTMNCNCSSQLCPARPGGAGSRPLL